MTPTRTLATVVALGIVMVGAYLLLVHVDDPTECVHISSQTQDRSTVVTTPEEEVCP